MTFHGFMIRDDSASDSAIYPAVREDATGVLWEQGDGDDRSTLIATAVEIYTLGASGAELGQFVRDVKLQVSITDSRVAFACPKYEKGGGWRGDPVSMIVLNTGSKLLAAAKRRGKCLVGQVRYPWVVAVGWRSKTKTFSSEEELRLTVRDGTAAGATLMAVDLTLPQDISSMEVASEVVRRAVASRLAGPLDAGERAELERIGREGVPVYNDGDKFTMTRLPGARFVGSVRTAAVPLQPPAAPPPPAPPAAVSPSPRAVPPSAPPGPPAAPAVAPVRVQPPPSAPSAQPATVAAFPARAIDEAGRIAARSLDFLPRFAVIETASPFPAALSALDLRYETMTWYPLPSGHEQRLDRILVKLTAHVGIDDRVEPARGRGQARLVRVFRGWSTILVTDERLVGVCLRGQSVSGPVDVERGTIVGWTFPLSNIEGAAVLEDGASVAVRSKDDLIGALVMSSPKRPVPGGGHEDVALDELAAVFNRARWQAEQRRGRTPAPPPPGTAQPPVIIAPPPVTVPPPSGELASAPHPPATRDRQFQWEYVTYLARGERSPLLGLGVDRFGRLDLDVEPPRGRYLTMGHLWVTTTPDGRAATTTDLAAGSQFRFGPLLDGGMDLAVFDDHILGVCGTGACVAGKLGEDGRMPALLFRLDLELVEEVSITLKSSLMGAPKETRFGLTRADFPSIALRAETIGRINGIPSWDGEVDGSKTSKTEAGRQIALAAAHLRLAGAGRHRQILERVIAGEWRREDGELIADLIPEEDGEAPEATPDAPHQTVAVPVSEPTTIRPAPSPPLDPPLLPPLAQPTFPSWPSAVEDEPSLGWLGSEIADSPPAPSPSRPAPPIREPEPASVPIPSSSHRRPRRRRTLVGVGLVVVVAVLAAGIAIGGRSSDRQVSAGTSGVTGVPLPTISAGSGATGGGSPVRGSGDSTPASSSPPSSGAALTLSSAPSSNPTELARQISLVEQTISDPGQPASRVAEAGRAQQLLLRRLDLDARLAAQAVPLIDPAVRDSVADYLAAGRSITSLIDPQPEFPDTWRIVAPPPAAELKRYFQAAEADSGVQWEYFAAIASVETQMGRIQADSFAGAQGPMQFIPETWERYGDGGDVRSFEDSTLAAGRLLSDNGGSSDIRGALYSYNPSDSYVDTIDRLAQRMIEDERQFLAIHQWQVLYKHVTGIALLPEGWPALPARIVAPLDY